MYFPNYNAELSVVPSWWSGGFPVYFDLQRGGRGKFLLGLIPFE